MWEVVSLLPWDMKTFFKSKSKLVIMHACSDANHVLLVLLMCNANMFSNFKSIEQE
jgi:hypothetical protein